MGVDLWPQGQLSADHLPAATTQAPKIATTLKQSTRKQSQYRDQHKQSLFKSLQLQAGKFSENVHIILEHLRY